MNGNETETESESPKTSTQSSLILCGFLLVFVSFLHSFIPTWLHPKLISLQVATQPAMKHTISAAITHGQTIRIKWTPGLVEISFASRYSLDRTFPLSQLQIRSRFLPF